MRLALLLNAVDPSLGGVLIAGQKGTGKTTAARALATLLPSVVAVEGCSFRCDPRDRDHWCDECLARFVEAKEPPSRTISAPFVELPLGATEDRVVGTLHVEEALRSGARKLDPGLLAAANRGVLYVDEVNLLDDHLVDLLLDAAATGSHRIEREGLSIRHPARFVLVGTMNPEEGDVRPQLLDRFGTSVAVEGLTAPDDRERVVRSRFAFEAEPKSFRARWEEVERRFAAHVARARSGLSAVVVSDGIVSLAVRLATQAKVHGHRAEIAILKASRALASLLGRDAVHERDVAECMRFVLRHRLPDVPMTAVDRVDDRLDQIAHAVFSEDVIESDEPRDVGDFASLFEAMQVPGAGAAGSIVWSLEKKSPAKKSSTRTR